MRKIEEDKDIYIFFDNKENFIYLRGGGEKLQINPH